MATLYAGTSGWAYPSWKPGFYPPKLPSKKFLEHYATRLNSVEVNYTFRRYATEKLLSGWIASTPSEFRFSIKANQLITHVKRLRDAVGATTSFISSLQPMFEAKKLGTVLFQLPPFLKCDMPLLKEFIAGLPRGIRCTFEFRNVSWFNDEVYDAMRSCNVALCMAESEKLEVPAIETADFVYYRLRMPEYTPEQRKAMRQRVEKQLAAGKDVFVYYKHEDTPDGALYAEELLKGLPRVATDKHG